MVYRRLNHPATGKVETPVIQGLISAATNDATGFRVADLPGTLTGNCGNNPGIACRLAWDITHSPTATQVVKVYLAGPVSQAGRIAFVRGRVR